MIKAIFLDMDDTLIVNQVIYERAEAMLFGYLHHFGVKEEEAAKAFFDIDRELIKTMGLSRQRYPATCEATLKHFVPNADADMIATVRGFAEKIFDTEAKVKPGVPEAIEILAGLYPLYIVTAGDRGVQEKRVSLLPFRDKFKGVFIVDKKDKVAFQDVARTLKLRPQEIVMIGDSVKSDVIPSLEAGMRAVWIEAHNSPVLDNKNLLPAEARKFASLLEAARHAEHHGTFAPVACRDPKHPYPRKKLG